MIDLAMLAPEQDETGRFESGAERGFYRIKFPRF
jgi:hypothetical protein